MIASAKLVSYVRYHSFEFVAKPDKIITSYPVLQGPFGTFEDHAQPFTQLTLHHYDTVEIQKEFQSIWLRRP